jgi:hypothetical protein
MVLIHIPLITCSCHQILIKEKMLTWLILRGWLWEIFPRRGLNPAKMGHGDISLISW